MSKIKVTNKFKKDIERIKGRNWDVKKIKQVIKKLRSGEKLNQTRYKPHKLYGSYEGCWECHVKDDWLLVWFFNEEGDLVLVRTGSHSDLFK